MYSKDKIEQFIQFRACGWSLARISREIAVPKSTLYNWGRSHALAIIEREHIERDEVSHSIRAIQKTRATLMARWLKLLENEYSRRLKSPESLSTSDLFKMAAALRAEFNELSPRVLDPDSVPELQAANEPPPDNTDNTKN
jgi:hypothetical protein